MSPEAQRIAIAKAHGWKFIKLDWDHFRYVYGDIRSSKVIQGVSPINVSQGFDGSEDCHFWQIPDYLNDLNAMHEAEKILSLDERPAYASHLYFSSLNDLYFSSLNVGASAWEAAHATAAQRAEAFLRTLNL